MASMTRTMRRSIARNGMKKYGITLDYHKDTIGNGIDICKLVSKERAKAKKVK